MSKEIYCMDCEILITKPNIIDVFGQQQEKPMKFKQGWVCSNCYNKKLKR